MVRDQNTSPQRLGGLLVGNYCHDVLIRDGVVVGETLGGGAAFISAVLDGISIPYSLVSKVGPDFAYTTCRSPIVIPTSRTTLFHAHFHSDIDGNGNDDRVLKRVAVCDPIGASDLDTESKFGFGMAVGVGGEIKPETLERMVDICDLVLVDIQALIREFDEDGTVKLVGLKESGFFHLLPRLGFLKASEEEAVYMDVEEVRKMCCVVVTHGKEGCNVYWKDGELEIKPFEANQVDPTGAGDSFLGGFVAGLVHGLPVPDAALVGNLFGSLTVAQIGLPKFDSRLLQRVKDEVQRRKMQFTTSHEIQDDELRFVKPAGHEQFHASLDAAKVIPTCISQECQWDLPSSPPRAVEKAILN